MEEFKFKTDTIRGARLEFTKTNLPLLDNIDTPLRYDPRRANIGGLQNGYNPHLLPRHLALLTIKEYGSAEDGYKSISTSPVLTVPLYVAGRLEDMVHDGLIVSDVLESNELLHPAFLDLKHLIGYELLQKY